jgi:hypothetical protein
VENETQILCNSARLQELKNLLLLYNLVIAITYTTRITKNSLTLIDAIVTKKQAYECSSIVLDLGYSDHLVQILNINVNRKNRTVKIKKRQFTITSTDEFNYLLQRELWQVSLSNSDVNTSFNAFMDMTLYHCNTTFPLNIFYRSNMKKNKWITQGIHNSCKRI